VEVGHDGPVPALASSLVQLARKWLGTPYSWGGGSPSGPTFGVAQGAHTKGFDCSAFAQYLYAQEGVKIPRTTYEQWKVGEPVDKGALIPGDLVFFEQTKAGPGHVGIYLGADQFIESPHTGLTIRISKLDGRTDYVGARRP
jgi:cell wall-associated NlpC family hydrolase